MTKTVDKNKNKILIVVAFLVVAFLLTSIFAYTWYRTHFPYEKIEDIETITLTVPSDGQEIIYSNDSIELTFSLTDIHDVLNKEGVLDEEDNKNEVYNYYKDIATNKKSVYFESLVSAVSPPQESRYLADFLRHGRVIIYDKEVQKEYEEIKVQKYFYSCGKGMACGSSGTQFVAVENGKVIFQIGVW
jgi:ABC-type metal ion transport system substrate-binding protein